MALGFDAQAAGTNATTLGVGPTVNSANSAAIGANVFATADNEMIIGNATNRYRRSGLNGLNTPVATGTVDTRLVTTDVNGNLGVSSFVSIFNNINTSIANIDAQLAQNMTDITSPNNRVTAAGNRVTNIGN